MARILVVDDSNLSRRMMRTLLESAGHQVTDVADGMSALEVYALSQPDMVLLDVTMRGMDGFAVLEKLRAMDPRAMVAMATADIQASTGEMAKAAGAVHIFHKPFDGAEIIRVVACLLERETE